jgi:hypothetical protein
MFAIFVADGVDRVERWASRRRYFPGGLKPAAPLLILAFIVFTFPALTPVRNEVAPSIVAASTAAQRIDPRREQLFVGHTMMVFMDLLAPRFPYTRVVDDRALPVDAREHSWILAEITSTKDEGFVFRRERGALWNISRRHYFDIKLAPLGPRAQFLSGWYEPEYEQTNQWRWMGAHSVTQLPPARGETLLRLHLGVPGELVGQAKITIKVNGRVLDSIAATGDSIERDYHVEPAAGDAANVLELSIDKTVPSHDPPREQGLRLRYLAWGPA